MSVANRRFHYDRAFEHYLRANAIAYVAVDEARRALSGAGAGAGSTPADQTPGGPSGKPGQGDCANDGQKRLIPSKLKSFDFVVYSTAQANLLIDVKGRKHSGKTTRAFQNWVTADDVACLRRWGEIFGRGFEPAFAFLFWCDDQPPDALFHEVFEFDQRWYALLAVRLEEYERHMRKRSERWRTVSIPAEAFTQLARPLQEFL